MNHVAMLYSSYWHLNDRSFEEKACSRYKVHKYHSPFTVRKRKTQAINTVWTPKSHRAVWRGMEGGVWRRGGGRDEPILAVNSPSFACDCSHSPLMKHRHGLNGLKNTFWLKHLKTLSFKICAWPKGIANTYGLSEMLHLGTPPIRT